MLRERCPTQDLHTMIPFIRRPGKGKTLGTDIRPVVVRDQGWGDGTREMYGVMQIFYSLVVVTRTCLSKPIQL